ncbi:MAG TPA: type VI secretion system tube protein Hcp [Nitrosopumilaceae archaeon]|nr:type VI secretion system tube protein Hcp [Nitrosopumilaceae archaeon]
MSKLWLLPVLLAVIISSSIGTAFAASDYYLKIDGIDGESTSANHKGEIDIQSFSWGVSNSGSMALGSGGGTGKVQFQDFHFTKTVDKSSPQLMQAVATGEHLNTVDLSVSRGGTAAYYIFHMENVMISSYSTSGGSGGVPMEEVSFTYQKIEMQYVPTNPDGSAAAAVKASWDLKTNTK